MSGRLVHYAAAWHQFRGDGGGGGGGEGGGYWGVVGGT